MHRFLLFFVIFFGFLYQSNAQDTGLSFEIHYPITFSDENYEQNEYPENSGIIGGKFQYQITDNIPFNFGVEYTFDVFQTYRNRYESDEVTPVPFLWSHINLYGKMLFESLPELQLYTTGGFTVYKYKQGGVSPNYLGFNAGGGLQYDIFNQIYLASSFSYVQARQKSLSNDITNKEKYFLVRIGMGFKI